MALMGELVSHKNKTKIFYLEPPGVGNCYLKKNKGPVPVSCLKRIEIILKRSSKNRTK
jgi:hypothetical protein